MLFWTICSLLLSVALLFVVLPLWQGRTKDKQVMRDDANLEIFRDQIAEMDADMQNGLLTQELYEQGKRELQARMLEEIKTDNTVLERNPHRILALALAVAIAFAAVGMYMKMGNYGALSPQAGGAGPAHIDAALKALEQKVAQNPQDTASMEMLARAYVDQERYADAAKIYNKLTQIVTGNAQLWADFADALAMASGQNLAGHPTILVNKALELDPNNIKALAMAGSAAMGRGDFSAAIQYWEKLIGMLPPNSEDAKTINDGLANARAALTQSKASKPVAAPLQGRKQ